MPVLLVVAFIVVPLVELAVVLQVREALGLGWTLLLLVAVSVLGAALVKREGRRAWRAFRQALGTGRPPATEVADGVMLLVGGTLLLTPGFVTDAVGLLLVLPPSRALLRRRVTGFVARRLMVRTLGVDPRVGGASPWGAAAGTAPARARGRPEVVEGEIVDDRPEPDRGGT